jgi:hypothetical protein
MIALASRLRIYLACGVTDMRKGMTGLPMLVQQGLAADPFDGAVFAFWGRHAGLIKLLWHDQNRPARRHHPGRDQIGMVGAIRLERYHVANATGQRTPCTLRSDLAGRTSI